MTLAVKVALNPNTINQHNTSIKIKTYPVLSRNFRFIWQYIMQPDLHVYVQSETTVHVTENVYRHNPYTHYIGKNTFDFTALVTEHAYTESKSANLSINGACSWQQRLQRQ